MQSVSSNIWTRVAMLISYDDNHYTTGTATFFNYLTHSWEDKGVHTFPKGICPKVNVIALYHPLTPSSITALIIPIMVTLCHNLVRLPPISLLQRGKKTDQKFLPGKVTMHSPAPRCDSLKVRPMALSERKRGLLAAEDWTPKGYIYCRTKTKKNNNSDFCSR